MSAAAPSAQRLAVSSGGALDDVAVVDLVLRFAGSHQALFLQDQQGLGSILQEHQSQRHSKQQLPPCAYDQLHVI
jgi:hypothetical protein